MDRLDRKQSMLIASVTLTAILMVGCRVANQESNESQNPMDEPLIFSISTEVQQEEPPVISELFGEEEEQEQEMLADADVYNRPSMQASQLGKVKEGDSLPVLGICEDNDWYKVVYNGRVAYIKAEAIAAGEEDVEDNNTDQNRRAQQASTNQGTAGTRRPAGNPSTTENPSTSHASSETEVSTEGIPSTEASSTTEASTATEPSPSTEDSATTEASPGIEIPPTTEAEQEESR